MKWLWILIGIVTLVMNIAAFCLMAIDKKRAKKGAWRIPQRRLFLVTALMGGLGGTLGMLKLRHKTKHWYFRVFFPLLLVLQISLLIGLWIITR